MRHREVEILKVGAGVIEGGIFGHAEMEAVKINAWFELARLG
jgi:hypothetical protein